MFEDGDLEPSAETLAELARVLEFPARFFFGGDIEEPSTDGASFRAMASMTAGQRDSALAAGALAVELSKWIEKRFTLPSSNVPSMRGFEPEAAAQALRSHWGIGERPIKNTIHLLEANGVRVFSIPRDNPSVHAFSLWHRDTPFVFLTTDKSGERGRFDAAHELGHLALHRHGAPRGRDAELEADRFASAFLMPRSSVLAHAPRAPSLSTLIRLKKTWAVSLMALIHRLRALDLLTEWQYRSLCVEGSQRGYRTSEPEGIQRESSQVLAKVFSALRAEGTTRAAVARDLFIETKDLDALVFGLVVAGVSGGGSDGGVPTPSIRPTLRVV